MMPIDKKNMIRGFKVISMILFCYLFVNLYNLLEFGKINSSNSEKLQEINFSRNIMIKERIFKSLNFCENKKFEQNLMNDIFLNRFYFYSFGAVLGAFLNSKKLMKIGVI